MTEVLQMDLFEYIIGFLVFLIIGGWFFLLDYFGE